MCKRLDNYDPMTDPTKAHREPFDVEPDGSEFPFNWFPKLWWDTLRNAIDEEFGVVSTFVPVNVPASLYRPRGTFIGWLFGAFGQAAVVWNGKAHFTSKWWKIVDGKDFPWDSYQEYERRWYAFKTVVHETYHVHDQRRTGWWTYLGKYIPAMLTFRGRNHPLEKPAYEFADKVMEKIPYDE
jgi:hypothetical protein